MNALSTKIKESRKLSDVSLKSYLGSLRKIKRLTTKNETLENTDFLKDFDAVMKVIKSEKTLCSRKNKTTAVLVALGSDKPKDQNLIDRYMLALNSMMSEYTSFITKQVKTESQKKNWIDYDEVVKVFESIQKDVRHFKINRKKVITLKEKRLLQQLTALHTYLFFPVRCDFSEMKVLDIKEFKKLSEDEQKADNYLVVNKNKKEFHINQFKNSRYVGSKVFPVPSKLSRTINIWLKHNTSGWFLVQENGKKPMNSNNLSKFITTIFQERVGKNVGTTLLRHIVVTKELKGEKTILEKKIIAEKLMHSPAMSQLYRKVD